jgi:hypothetical protein
LSTAACGCAIGGGLRHLNTQQAAKVAEADDRATRSQRLSDAGAISATSTAAACASACAPASAIAA